MIEPRLSPRHPTWIRVRAPTGDNYVRLKGLTRRLALHTVCEQALCPNIGECWGAGTATIMILGDTCTRACRFCAIKTGNPRGIVDVKEPARIAAATAELHLNYAVITSVDRDDLADGGSGAFRDTVLQIRDKSPQTKIELLSPDFGGRRKDIQTVVRSKPDVLGQNIETVRRLSPFVRDRRASYDQTIKVLRAAKEMDPSLRTKSSIMVGMGETPDEVIETMCDLRAANVDLLAIGQYLQPTQLKRHVPLVEYVHPDQFGKYREAGLKLGFQYVEAGPLVRSSYKAWQAALAVA